MIDDLALERQVCFALYSASRATTAAYRPMLDNLGLTYPQYLVMLVLWEHDGRGVREICRALDLDTGTLSPLLKRLEKLELIERTRQSDDERRVEIRLTSAGTSLREKAAPLPSTLACATGLSPDEHVALRELLTRLTRSLRDTPRPTPTHGEENA
ncbi:winged helix-turn-helix transcriptional regulator [Rhodococcus triatomae]|nr:MarR family winged helix-turn-helix transcriptional regulator [Rhodococcus triatomae]QNG17635.1 winged helix-turn-helix transcriptional regulator [Rhodococcus triatomae]QNG22698.1 winged helix-turn-helix transcriptional regulator [Rhodococcus triatomae]